MAKKRKAATRARSPNTASPVDPDDRDTSSAAPKTRTTSSESDDVHSEALERYEQGYTKDRDNQAKAYDDLRFLAEEEGQWDAKALRERMNDGRPVLTVNKVPQFVRQVTGDIRQMRPAIKIVPIDDAASEDVAVKILPGMLRYIEQRSDAKAAYFNGADQMVQGGIGHCRVMTEYASGTTFNQEIRIGLIEDGVSVVWDPDSIQPDRSDAMWCFVPVDMNKKAAEKKWPDKSFDALTTSSELFSSWFTDEHVRVCEYWRKVPMKRELALYPNGSIVDLTDDPDGAKRADAEAIVLPNPMTGDPGRPAARIEARDSFQVELYKISATEILEEPEQWPGAHIPITPFLGEEVKIGREIVRRGVVRTLKDVQRLYNYAISADAEAVALQPKAPYKGTRKNFEEFRDQWETANSKSWPYLEFTPDESNGGQAPQREPPPVASSGIKELLNVATADMSGVSGIYPASLGQSSNESSGKAILARQREGDTGTYNYIESFGRAIRRVGEIVVDLIPHIYDSERTIRIVGEDGKVDKMELNKTTIDPNGDGIDTVTMNDVTTGTYLVAVEMGPSFSTKREEARDGMATLMQTLGPQGAILLADLFVKSQDFPLADKIAARLALALPPQIQATEAAESGKPPPPPQPPPAPTPEQQAAAQKAADEEAQRQVDLRIKQGQQQVDMKKIEAELANANANLEKARLTHEQTMASHAATIAGHQAATAQAVADPRIDALVEAVSQLREAVVQIADSIGEHVNELQAPPEAEKPEPKGPPPPPDHMPALLNIIGSLANRKQPTGMKRTSQGMELMFDEAAAAPGIAPPPGQEG